MARPGLVFLELILLVPCIPASLHQMLYRLNDMSIRVRQGQTIPYNYLLALVDLI